MNIIQHPSPNFGHRKGQSVPSLVVIHHTAMETAEAALGRLCDPEPEVSAHYVISEAGCIWQLVAEEARAWHAGASYWRGERDVNSASVGIELANPAGLAGFPPFSEPQMAVLEQLLAAILERWGIGPDAVLGHSDVAPGRKADPGAKFDWERLARRGLAQGRPEVGAPGDFWGDLAAYGYDISNREAGLAAFRLRWRPDAHGTALSVEDYALAAGLRALRRP